MMNKRRKIAIVTSSRADYWLLKPLITSLSDNQKVEVQLIVTGQHLMPQHNTVSFIESDNMPIAARVEGMIIRDNDIALQESIGKTLVNMTSALSDLKPDLAVLLGDRFETFATATALFTLKIPFAHLHAGEATFGALDDIFRICISKMASIHFTSHLKYKRRLMQLGEREDNIYNVGACALDNIRLDYTPSPELFNTLNISPQRSYVICAYHPTTLANVDDELTAKTMLDTLVNNTQHCIIIMQANADRMGQKLNKIYEEYATSHPDRIQFVRTLPGNLYFQAVQGCSFYIGNSSSGIIEIPYFGKAVINIGDRQLGREAPSNVLHTPPDSKNIQAAVALVESAQWKNDNATNSEMVYGKPGNISSKISEIIANIDLTNIIYKRFEDHEIV